MKYEIKKHADGQITAKVLDQGYIDKMIDERINSYEDLFKIAAIKDAFDSVGISDISLFIPCLFGQRGDRRFNEGESFDLKIISNFINNMKFKKVYILHPHSYMSIALINNAVEVMPLYIIKQVATKYSKLAESFNREMVIVLPDAGAYKSLYPIVKNLGFEIISCSKIRDKEGKPAVSFSGDVSNKYCLIIDDLADGGRTFSNLAKQLKTNGARQVHLYVTHGQFNYGFGELFPIDRSGIDKIYTTDSYKVINHPAVVQYSYRDDIDQQIFL